MRVLIVTDAFPPRCGGSGWSTFHLARALAARGHAIRVVKPQGGLTGVRVRRYEGISVTDFGYVLHDFPYLRNFEREQWLAVRLGGFLVEDLGRAPVDVVHAQHLLSALPSIVAARESRVPIVVSVRDHWPTCYFTTAHVPGDACPTCGFAKLLRCMREKSPRAYWAGVPMMPYMRHSVRRRQTALRRADAVVAVSEYIAERVVRPVVGAHATFVIPTSIDLAEVSRVCEERPATPVPDRFLLFVGKISRSKGADFTLDVLARLRHSIPLVMLGEGRERAAIERRAHEQRLDVRLLPWVDNREVLRIMRRATLLLVPSLWPESLSRTVIEGMAVGVPVAATDCGGIHDQILHEQSGLVLPADASSFAAAVDRFLDDASARPRFVSAARTRVESTFDHGTVLPRYESLYCRLVERVGTP
jgi:glycogen synthase